MAIKRFRQVLYEFPKRTYRCIKFILYIFLVRLPSSLYFFGARPNSLRVVATRQGTMYVVRPLCSCICLLDVAFSMCVSCRVEAFLFAINCFTFFGDYLERQFDHDRVVSADAASARIYLPPDWTPSFFCLFGDHINSIISSCFG